MPQSYIFPKRYRLTTETEIRNLFTHGKRLYVKNFWIKYLVNNKEHSRLLVSISKKFGTAPERNRFKRLVRESFRTDPVVKNMNLDIAVVCSKRVEYDFFKAAQIWKLLLKKHQLHKI